MKFDVIVGNPPYQKESENKNQTHPLWDKFVDKAFDLVKEDGYVCLVHPNGWRDVAGTFEKTKSLLNSKQVEYLEMHDMNDGVKVFGVQTMYDWYVVKNVANDSEETSVKFQDGTEGTLNLNEFGFIPNGKFELIRKLIAKPGEERVCVLYDCAYHIQRDHVSRVQDEVYKYPCIYSIKMGDRPTLRYSSCNDKGHFGISKFIWGNGVCTSIGSIVDKTGEYGLTEFAYAIIDDIDNLNDIKKAFDSKEFKELMKACPNQNNNINRKVLALFKKDFYKDFI